eukprot:scaffold183_cov249-Pinguiococcus_pyrenoidosus.AAC.12
MIDLQKRGAFDLSSGMQSPKSTDLCTCFWKVDDLSFIFRRLLLSGSARTPKMKPMRLVKNLLPSPVRDRREIL